MSLSVNARKVFDKIQHLFLLDSKQTRKKNKLPQSDKSQLQKSTAEIYIFNALSLRSGKQHGILTTYTKICT